MRLPKPKENKIFLYYLLDEIFFLIESAITLMEGPLGGIHLKIISTTAPRTTIRNTSYI